MNRVMLVGRITRDPELRTSPNGVSFTSFSIAVNRPVPNAQGERVADFINCVAWRGTAEFCGKYFSKGKMIAIEGSIQTGSYEKDGVKRNTFDIVANNVSFCGDKGESRPASEEKDPLLIDADEDEDLPF